MGRRNKYRNKPVYRTPAGELVGREHGGEKTKVFDSQREYRRWLELTAMARAGLISGLRKQVSFPLHAVGGAIVCRYRADFVYIERGQRIVEDVKGRRTALYNLKKAWMLAEHEISIKET